MRLALQRLIESPSALPLSQNVIRSNGYCLRSGYPVKNGLQQHLWRPTQGRKNSLEDIGRRTTSELAYLHKDDEVDEASRTLRLVEYIEPRKTFLHEESKNATYRPTVNKQQSQTLGAQTSILLDTWQDEIATFDQLQYQSELEDRLVDQEEHATNWALWLALIRSQHRHDGSQGVRTVYQEIFRRELQLPIGTSVGNELWDLLLQSGFASRDWMPEIIAYAVRLKNITGQGWTRLYGSIVGHALRSDEKSVIGWHRDLKKDFQPSVKDYKYLFEASLAGNNLSRYMQLYRDLPIVGMYATIIPELCKLQRYKEARKWHNLLCIQQDFPKDADDIKPLLRHYVQAGNDHYVEQIMKKLDYNHDMQSSISTKVRKYIEKRDLISREVMYKKLGEVHSVEQKHLSDDFCARLFATKIIGVNTIISGLQLMGVESIGPLALREMASRDACDTGTVCQHLDRLMDAGIAPDGTTFSAVLVKMAREGQHSILRSVIECDLHPDTFEDHSLQERLLAEYYDKNEQLQAQRTLAILTCGCTTEQQRERWRFNLMLRANITLRNISKVVSTMDEMQRRDIILSSRTSQHIRCEWLSHRKRGQAAVETGELSILIKASQLSMQSGQYVPMIAWREISRRLGMAGRLLELENLTLWLADYYLGTNSLNSFRDRILPSNAEGIISKAHEKYSSDTNSFGHLKTLLFHKSAQQAFLAWGFMSEVQREPRTARIYRHLCRRGTHLPNWKWGLVLLKRLRERGVPIHKPAVAVYCRRRLDALFGRGVSERPIIREAKWANDQRAKESHRFRKAYYIKEMEAIWGQDLFRRQDLEDPEWRIDHSRGRRGLSAVGTGNRRPRERLYRLVPKSGEEAGVKPRDKEAYYDEAEVNRPLKLSHGKQV